MPLTPQLVRGSDVVDVARSLINTPFVHQGRIPQVGVDCVGVVLIVGWTLRIIERTYNPQNYSRIPDGSLENELDKLCQPTNKIEEGVIALIRLGDNSRPHHVGILSNFRESRGIIHAYQNVGRVREHYLGDWWRQKIVKLYQFPKVIYG